MDRRTNRHKHAVSNRNLLVEAFRNFNTGTTRFIQFAIISIVLCFFAIFLQVWTFVNITKDATTYNNSGASTWVINKDKKIAVNGKSCNDLSKIKGINSAGAVSITENKATAFALPDAPINIAYATRGFFDGVLQIISENKAISGVYISKTVANRLNKGVGSKIETKEFGAVIVKGVFDYPDDNRESGLGYSMVVPTNYEQNNKEPQYFSKCWAKIWPENQNLTGVLFGAVENSTKQTVQYGNYEFSIQNSEDSDQGDSSENKTTLSQLNQSFGLEFNGYKEYSNNYYGKVILLLFLIAFAVGFLSVQIRKLEIASNLHIGVIFKEKQKQVFFESVPIGIMLGILAIPISLLLSISAMEYKSFVMQSVATIFALYYIGYIIGGQICAFFINEKQLFKYFKNR